jgi:hypothetical protein
VFNQDAEEKSGARSQNKDLGSISGKGLPILFRLLAPDFCISWQSVTHDRKKRIFRVTREKEPTDADF